VGPKGEKKANEVGWEIGRVGKDIENEKDVEKKIGKETI